MAGSVNKVILVGNLGKDPESRSFQNGGKVVNFTLATSETWNDRASGERREKTEWHNVVIRNEKLGEIAERYLKKGSKVYIEGSIQSRKYEQGGQEKYITEVIVGPFRGELTLLSGRDERGRRGRRLLPRPQPRRPASSRPAAAAAAAVRPGTRRRAAIWTTRSRSERTLRPRCAGMVRAAGPAAAPARVRRTTE